MSNRRKAKENAFFSVLKHMRGGTSGARTLRGSHFRSGGESLSRFELQKRGGEWEGVELEGR